MGHAVQFVLHEYLQPLLQPCPSSLSLKNKDAVHPSPLKSLAAFTQKPCRTPLYKRSQTHQTSSAIAFSFLMFFSFFFFFMFQHFEEPVIIFAVKKRERKWLRMQSELIDRYTSKRVNNSWLRANTSPSSDTQDAFQCLSWRLTLCTPHCLFRIKCCWIKTQP